jgi:hypothetical protein
MKVQELFLSLLLFVTSSFTIAQINSFDKDAAPWHKKAVMTCGMLRDMKTFDQQKMLNNLDELSTELNVLQAKYTINPPAEYSNDPLWKSYFEDFADNIAIVKERVENKQYRLVQNYCGNFCRIFGRMHKNNGLTDITDLMFSLRAEIRGAMDMYNAQNYKGAKENLYLVKTLLSKVMKKAEMKSSKEFDVQLEQLKSSTESWSEAIEKDNKQAVADRFNNFMNVFPKPYMMTL